MDPHEKPLLSDEILALYLAGALDPARKAEVDRLLGEEQFKRSRERLEVLRQFYQTDPASLPPVRPPRRLAFDDTPRKGRTRTASRFRLIGTVGAVAAVALIAVGVTLLLPSVREGLIPRGGQGGNGTNHLGAGHDGWKTVNIWGGHRPSTGPILKVKRKQGDELSLILESSQGAYVWVAQVNRLGAKPLTPDDWKRLEPGEAMERYSHELKVPDPDEGIGIDYFVVAYMLDGSGGVNFQPNGQKFQQVRERLEQRVAAPDFRKQLMTDLSTKKLAEVEKALTKSISGPDWEVRVVISAWERP